MTVTQMTSSEVGGQSFISASRGYRMPARRDGQPVKYLAFTVTVEGQPGPGGGGAQPLITEARSLQVREYLERTWSGTDLTGKTMEQVAGQGLEDLAKILGDGLREVRCRTVPGYTACARRVLPARKARER